MRHPELLLRPVILDARGMWTAAGIVAAVVLVATLTPLPIVVTAIAGVVAMAVTGCLHKEDLY